ncbi:MAG: hypothetical protein QNJ72_08385 [Pleurocapsa sp. MO_226.B13]|nr:hypothetical protein [Pleurocapsa sp. MO_226.B13]
MELQVETITYSSNRDTYISRVDDFLITPMHSSIKADFSYELSEEDFANGAIKLEKVGSISAYRINLFESERSLAILADLISQDLCFAASYFLDDDGKNHLSHQYLYYIDEVFIKPEYRQFGLALRGLAMFLENFAQGEAVCCHPCPLRDLREKYEEKYGKRLLRRYWSKVGLNKYSVDDNILWTDDWSMPYWLKHQIFSED